MTALDEQIPRGKPIHPYDVADLLKGDVNEIMFLKQTPEAIVIDGTLYCETTSVPFVSHSFDAMLSKK